MTDELRLPCHESDSPDDWFIRKDGRQYSDDELVTDDDVAAHLNAVDPDGTRSASEIERVRNRLEAEAKIAALARRRHAKEDCHTSCRVRLECLDLALQNGEVHGTWGGYYEEELYQIQRKRRRFTD